VVAICTSFIVSSLAVQGVDHSGSHNPVSALRDAGERDHGMGIAHVPWKDGNGGRGTFFIAVS